METFEKRTEIACSADALFAWHARTLASERLQPPWDPLIIEQPLARLAPNESLIIRTRVGPVELRWCARIVEVGPRHFVDEQVEGPFSSWRHEHRFEPLPNVDGVARCALVDRITYAPPLGALGGAIGRVRERIERTFRFRHDTTRLATALAAARARVHAQLPAHVVGQEDPRVVAHTSRRARDDDRAQQPPRGGRSRRQTSRAGSD